MSQQDELEANMASLKKLISKLEALDNPSENDAEKLYIASLQLYQLLNERMVDMENRSKKPKLN